MSEVEHDGPYRLIRVVGSGGMGVVHEAWDIRLDRRVAVKMMHAHLLEDPAVSKRFTREARLAARLEHPNVVRVYRVDTVDGQLAIEMQFIDGTPLHVLLRSGPLSPQQGADILQQILEALAACHDQGVIHCDIKPANLLVTRDGRVVLTDFGISRALHAGGVTGAQLSGPLWGTPQYSPPEAWEGAPVTPQWDLYAAGVLVYEAIAGTLPYKADTPVGLMEAVRTGAVPSLSALRAEVSEPFSMLVASLMARSPAARTQSARAALEKLRQAPESHPDAQTTAPLPVISARTAPSHPRHEVKRQPWISVVMLLASALVVVSVFLWNASRRIGIADSIVPFVGGPETARSAAVPASAGRDPSPVVLSNDVYYFAANDPRYGRELWSLNASSDEARLAADIVPGPESSHPRFLRHRPSGGFVFAATTPGAGEELWYGESFGGRQSVRMIKDIIPGPMGGQPEPVAGYDTQILFYATTIAEGRELWCTNVQEAQTAIVSDLYPGKIGSMPMGARVHAADATVYFLGYCDGARGMVLFRYSFDSNTIREIGDVAEGAGWMTSCGDRLLLVNADDAHGHELWTYDPASSGLTLLIDIWPGTDSSDPSQLFAWGDRVLFQARTAAHGQELWVTDGTAAGTALVADINPGLPDSDPYGFTAVGDEVFFRAKDDVAGQELWVTDGTAAGTQRVADVAPGPESGEPYNVASCGQFLTFTAKDPEHGEELRVATKVNGRWEVELAVDLAPGPVSSEPHSLVWMHEYYGFFVATLPESGADLYRLNWDPNGVDVTPIRYLQPESAEENIPPAPFKGGEEYIPPAVVKGGERPGESP